MRQNNKIITCLIISMFMAGCAGRTANPISITRPGDDNLSCSYIKGEISEVEAKIQKILPDVSKTGKNVALGVTGAFFIVPLFFMDFSDAEKIEIEALQGRYNHLARLHNDKRCSNTIKP